MTAGAAPVARRFSRVQVEMLECVYQHRLLSTGQLHALYREGVSRSLTQRELAAMERVGWLASVRAPGGLKLWFVTERGADAVEAVGNRAESRRKVVAREQAAGPLQQHTLAVNEVGVIFARAARERGDEFGPLSWRNEIAHPIGQVPGGRRGEAVIADAVMSYEQFLSDGTYTHLRFVELDRATMATETLIAKLGRYVDLHEHKGPGANKRTPGPRLWSARYAHFPAVMVVLANASRQRLERRRWLTVARWKNLHAHRVRDVEIYVCLLEDLIERGPFAAIFQSTRHDGLVNWLGEPPEQPADKEPEPTEEPEPDDAADEPAMPSEPDSPEDPEPYPAPVRDAASAPDLPPLDPWDEERGWGR